MATWIFPRNIECTKGQLILTYWNLNKALHPTLKWKTNFHPPSSFTNKKTKVTKHNYPRKRKNYQTLETLASSSVKARTHGSLKGGETVDDGEDCIFTIIIAQASTYIGNIELVEGLWKNWGVQRMEVSKMDFCKKKWI